MDKKDESAAYTHTKKKKKKVNVLILEVKFEWNGNWGVEETAACGHVDSATVWEILDMHLDSED